MGWWQVKLSSGCPLAGGRGPAIGCRGPDRPMTASDGMRTWMRTGTGAMLVLLIMFIGSLGLWVGTPLLWLWSALRSRGDRFAGTALVVAFVGALVTISALGRCWRAERRVPRQLHIAGLADPGNVVLEGVIVVSAG